MPLANSIPPSIKSIQRGSINLTSVTSATATISAVNTAKSTVNFLGQYSAGVDFANALAKIVLTDSVTVTATRAASLAPSTNVSYEVIEYY